MDKKIIISKSRALVKGKSETIQENTSHLRRVSQLKICDFSGEAFKGYEVL
jgi:hypothetical protein